MSIPIHQNRPRKQNRKKSKIEYTHPSWAKNDQICQRWCCVSNSKGSVIHMHHGDKKIGEWTDIKWLSNAGCTWYIYHWGKTSHDHRPRSTWRSSDGSDDQARGYNNVNCNPPIGADTPEIVYTYPECKYSIQFLFDKCVKLVIHLFLHDDREYDACMK